MVIISFASVFTWLRVRALLRTSVLIEEKLRIGMDSQLVGKTGFWSTGRLVRGKMLGHNHLFLSYIRNALVDKPQYHLRKMGVREDFPYPLLRTTPLTLVHDRPR